MHLGGIAEPAGLAVERDGVRLDAVPQRAADLQMLLRAFVAYVVLDHFLIAVVRRFVLRARGHRIPGDAALGDVIEAVEDPRDMEWVMVGGRHGDAEADAV